MATRKPVSCFVLAPHLAHLRQALQWRIEKRELLSKLVCATCARDPLSHDARVFGVDPEGDIVFSNCFALPHDTPAEYITDHMVCLFERSLRMFPVGPFFFCSHQQSDPLRPDLPHNFQMVDDLRWVYSATEPPHAPHRISQSTCTRGIARGATTAVVVGGRPVRLRFLATPHGPADQRSPPASPADGVPRQAEADPYH